MMKRTNNKAVASRKKGTTAKPKNEKLGIKKKLAVKTKNMMKILNRKKKSSNDSKSNSSDSSNSQKSGEKSPSEKSSKSKMGEPVVLVPIPDSTIDKRKMLPGSLRTIFQIEGQIQRILQDERPDLFMKTALTDQEAELFDNYLRQRSEFSEDDYIYVDDNYEQEDDHRYSRYRIILKYSEGRYSAIYATEFQKVPRPAKVINTAFSMKIALRRNSPRSHQLMAREIEALKELQSTGRVPTFIEAGVVCDLPFFVMNVMYSNLARIQEDGKFTKPTCWYVALETLTCILEVHGRSFIHRDVKPTNFCPGQGQNAERIYIIDFGHAIRTKNKPHSIGAPDGMTLPYWSLDCHRDSNYSEKTDLESWFYMILELLEPKTMTWLTARRIDESEQAKVKFWEGGSGVIADRRLSAIFEIVKSIARKPSPPQVSSLRQAVQEAFEAVKPPKYIPQWVAAPVPVPTPSSAKTTKTAKTAKTPKAKK